VSTPACTSATACWQWQHEGSAARHRAMQYSTAPHSTASGARDATRQHEGGSSHLQQRACQAEELALAHTQVVPRFLQEKKGGRRGGTTGREGHSESAAGWQINALNHSQNSAPTVFTQHQPQHTTAHTCMRASRPPSDATTPPSWAALRASHSRPSSKEPQGSRLERRVPATLREFEGKSEGNFKGQR
jgi:hypothetical protein